MNDSIQKKVKKIELSTRRIMDEMRTGGYKSHFRGQGIQFSEHRIYTHGDDVRHMDWKVIARSREPLIKKYEEERELNVFIVADLSASLDVGTRFQLKRDIVAELGAVVAYAASTSGDRVGGVIFNHRVRKIIPLKKGKNHVLRIIHELLAIQPEPGGTSLRNALEETVSLMKHKGIIFVLSDFRAEGYEKALRQLGRKHDVVAVDISDPHEFAFEALGPLRVQDPESGLEIEISPSTFAFQSQFNREREQVEEKTRHLLASSGVESLKVNNEADPIALLVRFFQMRKQRKP